MRFRDFLAKTLLADTDWLVGYDADGKYIRVPKAALGTGAGTSGGGTGPSGGAATVAVQYSANGSSWHDNYTDGDLYVRIKAGSGAWSGAIRLCVSAYDIWLRKGNSGSEADFLASLKGEDGAGADIGSLQLRDIGGYAEFLQQVNAALANAKAAILAEVTETAVLEVVTQYKELQMEDIKEVRSLSDDDFLTIVTDDGLRKVKLANLSDNVAVRTVSTATLERSLTSQLKVLTVSGEQDGENREFQVRESYVAGTSLLFLNGQLLTPDKDYKLTPGGFDLLTHTPAAGDQLLFEAVAR